MALNVETSLMPDPAARPFEIVERKGLGHPDTICDALAERLSVALSRFYLERFGFILHHNVDKVLLWGGAAEPAFGGGRVTAPIEVFLAGRAIRQYKGVDIPVEALLVDSGRAWLRQTFHNLDPERHVKFHCLIRPGSQDLIDLFLRQKQTGVWLANDSSIGVGYAPLSPVEARVLQIDQWLRSPAQREHHPAYGEDLKLLALRQGEKIALTVACAFCDRYVSGIEAYKSLKAELAGGVAKAGGADMAVAVNAADDLETGSVFLTVTGTSAEAGDDGEAGRGNRANGLITPCRPMTMESLAGKNPVSHVGKLYNLAAGTIAGRVVQEVPGVIAAECYLASCIGKPVTEPRIAHVRIATSGAAPAGDFAPAIQPIVQRELAGLDSLWLSLLDGTLSLF